MRNVVRCSQFLYFDSFLVQEDLEGKKILEIVHPEDRKKLMVELAQGNTNLLGE